MYSVISVIVDSLPDNTKNRESTRSWTSRVQDYINVILDWVQDYINIILVDEFCAAWYDIKICPGVVNRLRTPQSASRPDHICTTIQSDGVTQEVNRSVRPLRVMEPSKGWTDQWGRQRGPTVGEKESKMPHCLPLPGSRSTGFRFWYILNLRLQTNRSTTITARPNQSCMFPYAGNRTDFWGKNRAIFSGELFSGEELLPENCFLGQ